jgi:hypothetical protein
VGPFLGSSKKGNEAFEYGVITGKVKFPLYILGVFCALSSFSGVGWTWSTVTESGDQILLPCFLTVFFCGIFLNFDMAGFLTFS